MRYNSACASLKRNKVYFVCRQNLNNCVIINRVFVLKGAVERNMLVLGIDPGTAICGYGFVEAAQGSRLIPHEYGAILTSPKARMQDRLMKLYDELDELIKKYKPDAMGVEQLFFNRNVTTAIPVGQARGIVLLAAAKNNIELVERTPLQIKQSVTGYGKATKEQVIYMVTKLLHLPEPPKPDDTADALAAAICTLHCLDSIRWRNG
jgi:crossover junction endodeoxyribonuclease RuvC